MITLICGQDKKLVSTQLNKYLQNFNNNEIEIIKNICNLKELYLLTNQISLFLSPKVFVYYNDEIFSSLSEFENNIDTLNELLKSDLDIVFVSYKKKSSSTKISKFINSINYIEISELNQKTKLNYISAYLNEINKTLSSDLLNLLELKLPNDAQIICNELNKLKYFKFIDKEVINNLIFDYEQFNVFNLLSLGFTKQTKKLFNEYQNIILNNNDVHYIMQILSIQLVNLLFFIKLKKNNNYKQISELMSLTYFTYQINNNLSNITSEYKVQYLIDELYKLDIKIKQNIIDKNNGFKYFLLKLIQ